MLGIIWGYLEANGVHFEANQSLFSSFQAVLGPCVSLIDFFGSIVGPCGSVVSGFGAILLPFEPLDDHLCLFGTISH